MALMGLVRMHAVAHAKRNRDEVVGPAHVLASLLDIPRLRERIEVDDLPDAAAVLGSRGHAVQPPTVSDEAERLIARCSELDDAIEVARELLGTVERRVPEAAAELVPVDPEALLADALQRLERMVGLDAVKARIRELVAVQRAALERKGFGLTEVPVGMNLVFAGNPGTGKTTVARIVADVYRALGLVSRGHLVEAHRPDLVGEALGHSEAKTADLVNRASGGVLFIDEAYALAPGSDGGGRDPFGQAAISTLVKLMEDNRTDLAVIAAGYGPEMEGFLESNPGLRSRFNAGMVHFADYEVDELVSIFQGLAKEYDIQVTPEVVLQVERLFERSTPDVRRGNARSVRNLFDEMVRRMAIRADEDGVIEREELAAFAPTDVPAGLAGAEDDLEAALQELDALVGLEAVKEHVKRMVARHRLAAVMTEQGRRSVPVATHLVFTGSPGTGKTTVARIVARIYRGLGLLSQGHLVEAHRPDLVGEYVGHSEAKTARVVKSAVGGVLFIDEAYALTDNAGGRGSGSFGQVAIATLVKLMEDNRGDLAVIVAGYDEEMERFLDSNAGLRSRFTETITFPDFSAEELLEVLVRLCDAHDIGLSDGARERVLALFGGATSDFRRGNARSVRSLFESMLNRMAVRANEDGTIEDHEITVFLPEDVPDAAPPPSPAVRIGFTV